MKFEIRIWHPNISSQTGAICLDILKDEWSPALTIRTALISLQALLCNPEPDDPQDAQVASQYKNKKRAFDSQQKSGQFYMVKILLRFSVRICRDCSTWDFLKQTLDLH